MHFDLRISCTLLNIAICNVPYRLKGQYDNYWRKSPARPIDVQKTAPLAYRFPFADIRSACLVQEYVHSLRRFDADDASRRKMNKSLNRNFQGTFAV